MAWVYLDNHGGKHRVGLYHGDQSGHLAIHCNLKIIQIDFSVKETRTYSFFIEEELCEITLEKMPDGTFQYGFELNKKVDTPLNRLRKADDRKVRKQLVYFGLGFVSLLAILFFGLKFYGKQQREKQLALTSLFSQMDEESVQKLGESGKNAEAQLILLSEAGKRRVVYGFLTADSLSITGSFVVPDSGVVLLPNFFPLADRDAFAIRYLPENPKIHRLDFFHPTQATITRYHRLAIDAEKTAHPAYSLRRCACRVQIVLDQKGWFHLPNFIYQDKSPKQNERFNSDAYLRMVRDVAFVQAEKDECWQE